MLCIDTVNVHAKDMDISDDSVWNRIRAKISSGTFQFIFAGPPCRTFSMARQVRPGPPPLRDRQHPYGFPRSQARRRGISTGDLEKVRLDNLLAIRTAEACSIMLRAGKGFAVEQPALWGPGGSNAASMFDLEPFVDLKQRGAKTVEFDQCRYGADTTKPTQLLYFKARFDRMAAKCNHPVVTWQHEGKEVRAPHRPCVGTKTSNGEFATSALAAYPRELNQVLAYRIAEAIGHELSLYGTEEGAVESKEGSIPHPCRWEGPLIRVLLISTEFRSSVG